MSFKERRKHAMGRPEQVEPWEWAELDKRWQWRKTRDVGLSFEFWPLIWSRPSLKVDSNHACWVLSFSLGPFDLRLNANIGSGFVPKYEE